MHFHAEKDESWFVLSGSFKLLKVNTRDASITETLLLVGDQVRNKPLEPHQLIALEDDSEIIEVSTKDCAEDNYRVMSGDSQMSV